MRSGTAGGATLSGSGAPLKPTLTGRRRSEGVARWVTLICAAALLFALAVMLVVLGQASEPLWKAKGLSWIWGSTWNPSDSSFAAGSFGALPFILGTLVTSAIGLILAAPIAVGTALFISELCPLKLRRPLGSLVDLLAAVPSVVFGLWGIFVVVPLLTPLQVHLSDAVGRVIPLFRGPTHGDSFLVAGVVLAIMILPTISAVSREVFVTIPRDVREGAYALGATRWEAIRTAVLPPSRSGVIGALILGLGRALGETIAVTMVIGNTAVISKSILVPGYSMASVIASEFSEAGGPHLQALIGVGLLLFVITVLVDVAARLLVHRTGAST